MLAFEAALPPTSESPPSADRLARLIEAHEAGRRAVEAAERSQWLAAIVLGGVAGFGLSLAFGATDWALAAAALGSAAHGRRSTKMPRPLLTFRRPGCSPPSDTPLGVAREARAHGAAEPPAAPVGGYLASRKADGHNNNHVNVSVTVCDTGSL